jgi:hypothetical protein
MQTILNSSLFIRYGVMAQIVGGVLELVKASNPTALSTARRILAATTVGNYALFGGGNTGSNSSVVDAYDTDLTRSTPTALSTARRYLAATTVGDYALFGGGTTGLNSSVVDAYGLE